MGFAEARATELREALNKPIGVPLPSENELRVLKDAAERWSGLRRDQLSELLKALEPYSGTSVDAWRNHAEQLSGGVRILEDALRSLSGPGDWARRFVQMNGAADAAFTGAVGQARVVA